MKPGAWRLGGNWDASCCLSLAEGPSWAGSAWGAGSWTPTGPCSFVRLKIIPSLITTIMMTMIMMTTVIIMLTLTLIGGRSCLLLYVRALKISASQSVNLVPKGLL